MSWPLSDIFSHTLEIQKPPLVSSRLVPTGKKINAAMGFKPIILAKMVNFTQSAVTKRELKGCFRKRSRDVIQTQLILIDSQEKLKKSTEPSTRLIHLLY